MALAAASSPEPPHTPSAENPVQPRCAGFCFCLRPTSPTQMFASGFATRRRVSAVRAGNSGGSKPEEAPAFKCIAFGTFQTRRPALASQPGTQQFGLPRISATCLNRPFAERLKRSLRRSTPAAFQKRAGIRLHLDWQHDGQAAASLTDQLILVGIRRGRASFRLHVDQSTKPNCGSRKFWVSETT